MDDTLTLDLYVKEQIARIDKEMAEHHKFAAEETKLRAEALKLYTEERKLERERWWFPWLQIFTALVANTIITVAVAAAVTTLVARLIK